MPLSEKTREALAAMVGGDWFRYPESSIPSPVDDATGVVVRAFAALGDDSNRRELWGLISDEHIYVLRNFAVRMAALAVRQRSAETLGTGLFALALAGGSPRSDPRDLGFAVPPLRDAARRIEGDHAAVFEDAARIADPRTAWLLRDAGPKHTVLGRLRDLLVRLLDRSWTAVDDADGFRYETTGYAPSPEVFIPQIEEARRRSRSDR
jgi:hypothetical protein